MLRKRMLIGLGGCFLASGAAWADGVAYVDCASHPETTLVFGKPRRTPETVAAINCGERFTILQYGFIFSRVQTKDGQVGYVYSNLISADRSGGAAPQSATRANAAPATVPTATTTVAPSNPAPVAQPQGISIQQAPVEAPAVAVTASKTAPGSVPIATPPTQTQVTAAQSVPASAVVSAPAPATPSTSGVSDMRVTSVPPASAAAEQPKAAHGPSAETAAPAVSVPEPSASVAPEAVAPATPTEVTPAAQPEAAPAEPAASAPIRAVRARESWERPNAGGRRLVPLFDLFGGYGFARFDNGAGASASNLNGEIGSFSWNVKPWLQVVADSSYNFVTVSGVKSVMYGNHWGPRIFYRGRNRWGLTPFVEGLVGGTRADITVPGPGGFASSQNVLSYKVGGGLDMKLSRKIEIRLIDVDYYRTSFGTNLHQNNYWASAGIVLRLFGGSE